jgi:CheY-like chemotaxis protein
MVLDEPNNPVLIVEDEPAVRRMTRAVLESVTHLKIYEAADAAFALKMLEKLKVDFLVCDKNLPDQDGLEVIRQARRLHPSVDAMIVTGYPSPESAAEAIRMGATDYLLKPVREVNTLRESVCSALRRQRLLRLATRHERVFALAAEELRSEAKGHPQSLAVVEGFLAACGRPPEPPRPVVAVLDTEARSLQGAGVELVPFGGAAELRRLGMEVDLVVFPAESTPEAARELLDAARRLPSTPALCGLGQFAQTETAVVALQGRTSVVLDRGWPPELMEARLREAAARQRREARAEALGRLLQEVGFRL